MRYSSLQVVFQEVPNEITLAFHMTGCPLRCNGCHSGDSWSPNQGQLLDLTKLECLIEKYKNYISCVLFLGGEWEAKTLQSYLQKIKQLGLKTALYTGLESELLSAELLMQLDYLKTGPYIAELGGLDSPNTNQKLINLKTNEILNFYFTQGGALYDSTR